MAQSEVQGCDRNDEDSLQLLVWNGPPASRRTTLPVLLRAAWNAGTPCVALRSREGTKTSGPSRTVREGPGHSRASVRRLRAVRDQDGNRERQDEGHGAHHCVAVLQRRRR